MNLDYILKLHCLSKNKNIQPPSEVNKVYGFEIDYLDSNPNTSVSYIEDAQNSTPASINNSTAEFEYGSWKNRFPFNKIRPCVMNRAGTEILYYLNPDDYSKKIDGTNANINGSAGDGNVMVEIPKIYWKMSTTNNKLTVKYSDTKIDDTYGCFAHQNRSGVEYDNIYVSAYMGYESGIRLISNSNLTPTVNKSLTQFRTLCNSSNNTTLINHYQVTMLQLLFVMMFKTTNSQEVLGNGYTSTTFSNPHVTGTSNARGMYNGNKINTSIGRVKFCGIEDFYGNIEVFVDGIYINSSRDLYISQSDYSNTGNYGYVTSVSNGNGYISKVMGSNKSGFLPSAYTASDVTGFCDTGSMNGGYKFSFGGSFGNGATAGAFAYRARISADTSTFSNTGARFVVRF